MDDTTEHVRDYRELIESEGRLRAFVDHGPVLAFMKDDQLRYIYVNPTFERTFQIRLADIRGKADVDWLPPSVAGTVRGNDLKVLESGDVVETIESAPTPDGAMRDWMVVKFPFAQPDGRRFVGGVAVDITALRHTQAQLVESERRYRQLVESAQGLICTHDLEGRLLSVNPAALAALGYSLEEVIGTNLRNHLSAEGQLYFDRYLELIGHRGSDSGLMYVLAKSGVELAWQYHNVKVVEPGQAPYVLGHAQDVTELRDAQVRMQYLAMTDELTGLPNRRGFFANAAQALREAEQHHRAVAVVYVDIDGLKQINDDHGHETGSSLIAGAASVLKNTFRAADVVARMGGDEFVVLAAVSRADAAIVTGRMNRHLDGYNASSGLSCRLSLSVGMALVDAVESTTLEELVRHADASMYERKRLKRAE